jgi:hypothetical protein
VWIQRESPNPELHARRAAFPAAVEPVRGLWLVTTITASASAGGHLSSDKAGRRGAPAELLVVWALCLVVAAEIFATYTRLPPEELYHVSGSGLAAGAGRVLVFLNYPTALIAIVAILVVLDRLPEVTARVVGLVGIVLGAAVFWPGVVDQADLDARPVNALAALGTASAVGITIVLVRRGGVERPPPLLAARGDRLRVGIAAAAVVLAVPWLFADLGFSLNGVPVLGTIWQTGELRSQPGAAGLHPAVHHGHHHGMDGVLLVVTALLVSRKIPAIWNLRLRVPAAALLSLMLAYGVGQTSNDFWIEQVVKRQWTDWEIPDMTRPSVSIAWGLIILAAISIYVFWFGRWSGRDRAAPVPIVAEAP